MGKKEIYIERLNLDAEFIKDLQTGNGFRITEASSAIGTDNEKAKSLFGLYSPLYGTDFSDEQAFVERYSCKCKATQGKLFEGEECPYCKTIVEYKDVNIKYTGWLDFGNHKVISPLYYNILDSAIGEEKKNQSILKSIIKPRTMVDINGIRSEYNPDLLGDTVSHPFVGIGLTQLRKRLLEVLDYFEKKKPKNHDKFQLIRDEISNVWTSHIPVYSTFMRPMSTTSDSLYFTKMDKQLSPLFTLSRELKESHPKDIEIESRLCQIQERLQMYWDVNFDQIDTKHGWIRKQVVGGSMNFTSRNVVVPVPTLTEDQVSLSYHTFIELYKFDIMRNLMKYAGLSLTQAEEMWCSGYYQFSPMIYQTMCQIIKDDKPQILLYRNPTLHSESFALLDIVEVKSDFDDYTLGINIAILPGTNMDFDGDVPNITALVNDYIKHTFRKLRPSENFLINKREGTLNTNYRIQKSQMIDLCYFCTMD